MLHRDCIYLRWTSQQNSPRMDATRRCHKVISPDVHVRNVTDSDTCFFIFSLYMSFFPGFFFFFTISAFSLYGEYVVRSFLPNGVFLPCDDGLDF